MDFSLIPTYTLLSKKLNKNEVKLKIKGKEQRYYQNTRPVKSLTVLISGKIRLKAVTQDKEEMCIIIKGTIHKEEIIFTNLYAPNSMHINIKSKNF